nr:hypothetical protein Iba_chr06bCG13720 [Ipomoea batatas]
MTDRSKPSRRSVTGELTDHHLRHCSVLCVGRQRGRAPSSNSAAAAAQYGRDDGEDRKLPPESVHDVAAGEQRRRPPLPSPSLTTIGMVLSVAADDGESEPPIPPELPTADVSLLENSDIPGGNDEACDLTIVQMFILDEEIFRGRLGIDEGRKMHIIFGKLGNVSINDVYRVTSITILFQGRGAASATAGFPCSSSSTKHSIAVSVEVATLAGVV